MKNLPTIECSMLEAFEDTSLGNLNTIERDGTLYVPAIEMAMILGYRNPRDAIRRHCVCDTITVDEWVITGKKADGSDAIQCVHKKYISESDFYRLIFHSRLPIAEEFTRWICEEVLPHIRRYGCYPGKKFLRSAAAYMQALEDAIAGKISYAEAAEISDAFQKLLTDMQGKTPPRRDSGGKTELQLF